MQVTDPALVLDRPVLDRAGDEIGTVTELYLDDAHTGTDRAGWIAVRTGLFGHHVSLVPLTEVEATSDGSLVAAFDKARVKDAPHHDPEMALSTEEEAALFAHYGMAYAERGSVTVTSAPGDVPTDLDFTTEDAERLTPLIHQGAGQQTRLRRWREADPAGSRSVDLTEPAAYPGDELEAELARDAGARERAVQARRARGE